MKIALLGSGKMGTAIRKILQEEYPDTRICLTLGSQDWTQTSIELLKSVDVAIEFSSPQRVHTNLSVCLKHKIAVVCGTTGWLEQLNTIQQQFSRQQTGFIYASNFSIGVNIFFEVNKLLAKLMGQQLNYKPFIEEIHHIHKKDSPSGTAITLAEEIIENNPEISKWVQYSSEKNDELVILSDRKNEVPGTHMVNYSNNVDQIRIIHQAFNREGFARGAIQAALWLKGKQGVYTMKDVLGFK